MEGSLSGFGGDLEDAQHPVMVLSLLRNLTSTSLPQISLWALILLFSNASLL
jgi:hypothetical protein